MTTDQKQLIKATVPVLKESGVLLTTYFYKRVFAGNPELQHVFNQANQQSGKQPAALAMAVLAYAENIDDPSVLLPVVTRIGHKHTSLAIRPEHYGVIGRHLIASIREVLGEAATPALLDAWTAAYGQLATLMISIEAGLYAAQAEKPGGWTGWRPFVVGRKQVMADGTTDFQLHPVDGGPVVGHEPGQYLSIRLFLPQLNLLQPRQYRPINVPNGQYYSISVKQGAGDDTTPNALFSKHLLEGIREGDHVEVSAPAGVCPVTMEINRPVMASRGGGCPMHQPQQSTVSHEQA